VKENDALKQHLQQPAPKAGSVRYLPDLYKVPEKHQL
jgi:hypothetical protein